MKKLNIAIVIVSDSRTLGTDKSGKLLKKLIEEDGHKIIERVIVPDNIYEIRSIVSQFIVNKKIDVSKYHRFKMLKMITKDYKESIIVISQD